MPPSGSQTSNIPLPCHRVQAGHDHGRLSATDSLKNKNPKRLFRLKPGRVGLCVFTWLIAVSMASLAGSAGTVRFNARVRDISATNKMAAVACREVELQGPKTSVIVCDMWDRHWCRSASARVAEMAPRMNDFLKAARNAGMLIVHAPSGTMDAYQNQPQRQRARQAVKAPVPAGINSWKPLNKEREGTLPIDDSDGGCDDEPKCPQGSPWRSQIATLDIDVHDAVSDNGEEVYGLLQEHGIKNVLLLGVHANMCVLGRPFGIRAMVTQGKNVLLVRDLTDTMYNPRQRPFVNHFAGTDLVVEHIERYWCPTITSADLLGAMPFRFAADRRPTVVMIVAESEYHTWETLPEFATNDLLKAGLRVEYVVATTRTDDYRFHNTRAIAEADLVLVSARRRAMPMEMATLLRKHVESGKPVIGIRTASHAFAVRGTRTSALRSAGLADWPEFDAEVLGGNYTGHHPAGPRTTIRTPKDAAGHPILAGIPDDPWSTAASLYKTSPLKPTTKLLLTGTIQGQSPEPLAWINTAGPREARVFYTSLGHPEDFQNPSFRRLLRNAMLWAMGRDTSTP